MLGEKNVFKMRDRSGDVLSAELRYMTNAEASHYNSEKFEYNTKGRKVELDDISHKTKINWFDKLVIVLEYVYPDAEYCSTRGASGNKVLFSMANPIPPDELTRLASFMGLNGEVKSQLNLIPAQFKIDAMSFLFDQIDTQAEEELKKK
jgi:hypothetical protein